MIKKTIGSFVTASALCISLGGMSSQASTQNQWNDFNLDQEQHVETSSPASIQTIQKSLDTTQQIQIGHSSGVTQGQMLSLTGYQFQQVKTSGPATVSQSEDRDIDMGDSQSNGQTDQDQTTQIEDSKGQETTVSGPSTITQSQRNTDVVFHFQASIKNGPSLQHQFVHNHSYQFQNVYQSPFLK